MPAEAEVKTGESEDETKAEDPTEDKDSKPSTPSASKRKSRKVGKVIGDRRMYRECQDNKVDSKSIGPRPRLKQNRSPSL